MLLFCYIYYGYELRWPSASLGIHPSPLRSNMNVNQSPSSMTDEEKLALPDGAANDVLAQQDEKKSVYASLGWLDRLLALWILLAIVIGILLGNFVDGVEDALQKGKFINVSVPIGPFSL